jgi:hypothetical protein
MLLRVALVRTDVSEERIASIIEVARMGELGITVAVTSNRSTILLILLLLLIIIMILIIIIHSIS